MDVDAPSEPPWAHRADWVGRPFAKLFYAWQCVMNGLASRMGAPIYLVGSALEKPDPHDYDLRVILTAAEIERLFGTEMSSRLVDGVDSPQVWRRRYEDLKQSRRLSRKLHRNIDFQTQTAEDAARYAGQPRVRVDWAPEGFFEAGLKDA